MPKMTEAMIQGVTRPPKGPYPKGVINGPDPTTERGLRRRRKNTAK